MQVIMPCGTGKTLTAIHIDDMLNNKVTIVLLPSITLLRQTYIAWRADHPQKDSMITCCICSDTTVVLLEEELQQDTVFHGIEQIPLFHTFLEEHKDKKVIIFSTYHSAHIVFKNIRPVDFILFDEAHKTSGLVDKVFQWAVHDRNIPAKYRLFMTATPTKQMRRGKIYGNITYELTFSEAVDKKLLVDYKLIVIVSSEEYTSLPNRCVVSEIEEHQYTTSPVIPMLSIISKQYGVKKILCYYNSVKSVQAIIDETTTRFSNTFHGKIIGEDVSSDRQKVLQDYVTYSGTAMLHNIRCLTEGIDVPAIDMVSFIEPRRSRVDIIQAVGRAMRVYEGKEFGYIFVPIVLPKSSLQQYGTCTSAQETVEKISKESEGQFASVVEIISALNTADDRGISAEEIQFIKTGEKHKKNAKVICYVDIPELEEKIPILEKTFQPRVVEGGFGDWNHRYDQLKQYVEKEGRLPTQTDYTLITWVNTQRRNYKKGILEKSRRERLEAIPYWSWDPHGEKWWQGYTELKRYVEQENMLPIQNTVTHTGYKLGNWIDKQRQNYKKGILEKDKQALLAAIPYWSWDPNGEKWWQGYTELKIYVEQENKLPVGSTLTHTGFQLGSWVNIQRHNYKNSTLKRDKQELLEAIPYWSWDPHGEKWWQGYTELKKYVEQKNRLPVGSTLTHTGFQLDKWLDKQRQNYKKGTLEKDKKELLEAIPYWSWDPNGEKWWQGYTELKIYVEQENRLPIQTTVTHSGYKLGTWVSIQRHNYKNSTLKRDKQELLEAIPYWSWDPHGEKWWQGYTELKRYVEQENRLPIEGTVTHTGYKLGSWVNNQRYNYRKNVILEKDKKELLEAIPYWAWSFSKKLGKNL